MAELVIALLLALPSHSCSPRLVAAITHVESRGSTWAVSPSNARGLMQVVPDWSPYPASLLHIPAVNRAEGCRIYKRWLVRAQNRCRWERANTPTSRCNPGNRALQAYSGGVAGLRNRCTTCAQYAKHVSFLARLQ
jgi:soluble lytic murein transglycosylase-like protein